MPEDIDKLYDLRDDVDRHLQHLEAGEQITDVFDVADERSAIRVSFDVGAKRWTAAITEAWRSDYETEELPPAIVELSTRIGLLRAEQWSTAIEEDADDARTRPLPPNSQTGPGRLVEALQSGELGIDAATAADRLLALVTELNAGFEAVMRTARERGTTQYVGRSVGGNVTVAIGADGLPLRVELAERWLETARASSITSELNGAAERARQKLLDAVPADPLAGTPLARFSSLATDPEALTRLITE